MNDIWDCLIVGGGAAGLSAGLVLGRARRRTLLIDAGAQSNLAAPGVGGLLGHDGRPPAELYAAGRGELASYGVRVRTGEVVEIECLDGVFTAHLDDAGTESARRVLLATGMQYRLPELPGLDQLWGRSVFHCPFCHGWEARDQPLAVLARDERAVHSALLLRVWSDDIVLLTDGPADLGADDRARLAAAGVSVDERPVAALDGRGGELSAVVFADGTRLPRRGLLVAATMRQRSRLAEQLGVAPAGPSPVADDPVGVDPLCRTSVPGVFAAGDLTAEMPQVAAAIAAGSRAAAAVVQSLAADDYGLPLPPIAERTSMTEPLQDACEFWEQFYTENERVWSGRVNARLAEVASGLSPGRALDLGCGEGGDAIWLAEQGWQVLAVDVSTTALQRASAVAEERDMLSRIGFERHDLSDSFPDGRYDLVSAQFLHSTARLDRETVLRRAADAVAVGGTLLIVDHAAAPPWAGDDAHGHEFPTIEGVLTGLRLDGERWDRVRAERAEREAVGPDGQAATLADNVFVLRRTG